MTTFHIGQRWISESEPELGLGRVIELEHRRVRLLFPATGEERLYATQNPPLKRVRYTVGETIRGKGIDPFTIESIREKDGCLIYSGPQTSLHEADLEDAQTFDKPDARLAAGHIDTFAAFDLRLETHRLRERIERSPVRGLLGGRIDLLPHQLYIATEISRRDAPRVLLADEVGLGKTIEACLILHRLLLTGKISRVLILTPDALVHQWFVELLRRFSLTFSVLDHHAAAATEETPFAELPLVIAGIQSLLDHPPLALAAVHAGWDLVIVDEAHHLEWSPESPSPAYLLVEAIARAVPGLLLLTATPEQLGPESHFARLRLLDPHRYPDLERYLDEHRRYASVVKKANRIADSGDESALQDLLDRHGPGRVIFRNTRAVLTGFPQRHLHAWPLDPPAPGDPDPRALWLASFLRKHPKRKVLVITQTRKDVLDLHQTLQTLINVDTALFHEDMPLVQCDRQAAWFAEPDGARLLLASEIGGEGRNFQFCQHLVLHHLPPDPEMLEQRIGRLDRIGQAADIHLHVPHLKKSPEADRLRWFHEGLNAFEEPLAGSHDILKRFQDRLHRIDAKLIAETKAFRLDLKKRIEQGRDRLLELNSCRPALAAETIRLIEDVEASPDLPDYLTRLGDHFGLHVEPLPHHDVHFQRGPLYDQAFPLKEEELHATFSRTRALVREDLPFISWDHPMVASAMDLLTGSEAGNASLAIASDLHGVLLHAVFLLEAIAPKNLELNRFLPPTPIPVLVGPADHRPTQLRPPQAWELVELQPALRSLLPGLIDEARDQALHGAAAIREAAKHHVQAIVGREAQRLRELQKINDHIRDDEIVALEDRVHALLDVIDDANLRLDAVLLILGR
ncbi:MAG TPA: SNF2-related protein [Kiritimatiellia bacterium]|nr:SNF2-related protein [Kiritimatiellia bacterium]